MPLKSGDSWRGLDTLRIVDNKYGKVILDGMIISDMDINPTQNRVTIIVNSDIGHDGTHKITQQKANNGHSR